MAEIQVSNARRVGFTAMALVVFWVLAWRAHSIGWHAWLSHHQFFPRVLPGQQYLWPGPTYIRIEPTAWGWAYIASLAILPFVLLSFAVNNRPLRLKDWRTHQSGVFVVASIGIGYWSGEHSVIEAANRFYGGPAAGQGPWPPDYLAPGLWLLLPLLLTTAFVIYGAWRSAVRDAEAATSEDDV